MVLVRLLAFVLLFGSAAAHAKRVAIIIANESYANEARLSNPVRDARAIAAALGPQGLKFDTVTLLTNLDQKGLRRAILSIGTSGGGADTLIVYFSGHGIRDNYRRNFLLPVDAQITREDDIPVEGIDAEELISAVREAKPRAGLVVLDACRNNPFTAAFANKSTAKGLARRGADGLNGVLVAYAADGGQVADDGKAGTGSPYGSAFARLIGTPGRPLLAVLDAVSDEVVAATNGKQLPTRDGNLRADYVLVPGAVAPSPVRLASVDLPRVDLEREMWDVCKAANGPAPCRAYLARYGSGTFAELARFRLDSFGPTEATPAGAGQTATRRALATITASQWRVGSTKAIYNDVLAAGGTRTELAALAIAGDVNAMALLGSALAGGFAGARDDVAAQRWLRAAADAGQPRAIVNLSAAYAEGMIGLIKDEQEAVRLLRLAVAKGDPLAQRSLAFMYFNGRGIAKDEAEAIRLVRSAAEQGVALAQTSMGYLYQTGDRLPQNKAEAVRWFRLAAEQGEENAQHGLGYAYSNGEGVAQDKREAVRLYLLASAQGVSAAQANLARMYWEGDGGLAKDPAEAARLYRLAADQGQPGAQTFLGYMHETGQGVAKDQVLAIEWYRKAAAQNNQDAINALKRLKVTP